jgi:hypothetical protein
MFIFCPLLERIPCRHDHRVVAITQEEGWAVVFGTGFPVNFPRHWLFRASSHKESAWIESIRAIYL